MPKINVLPKNIAELIAAGEVVERPASVIKELVENAIDAGADNITVEIKRGGITYMRVTDNGCGIAPEQVKTAFLRHATSKISTAEDLNSIMTLGFRGEALASICAVSKVEVLTAEKNAEYGVSYVIDGGEEVSFEKIGCPAGTTVIVSDLFYNVPARMKFLKKDVTEGSTVGAIIDRMALSHPEISFRFIRDEKNVLTTSGDGKLRSAIYAVLGRDYSAALIEMPPLEGAVSVSGFLCTPTHCRPNRNGQFFFINGRYIKSGTIAAALDQAYKNSAMVGKFPAGVLNITLRPEFLDVNVHPTKTEVRFTDERSVFDAVYRAAKGALAAGDRRPELNISAKKPVNMFAKSAAYEQMTAQFEHPLTKTEPSEKQNMIENSAAKSVLTLHDDSVQKTPVSPEEIRVFSVEKPAEPPKQTHSAVPLDVVVEDETAAVPSAQNTAEKAGENVAETVQNLNNLHYVGEAFATYIIVSIDNNLYFIDKHAAHERMNFERLKAERTINSQLLLEPVAVDLMPREKDAVLSHLAELSLCGFEVEDFGTNAVVVRAVPSELSSADVADLMMEISSNILEKGSCEADRIDQILHSVACKAAIKAGYKTSVEEQLALAKRVLSSTDLMYCPHGRPIAFKLTKNEIEKQFGRLV